MQHSCHDRTGEIPPSQLPLVLIGNHEKDERPASAGRSFSRPTKLILPVTHGSSRIAHAPPWLALLLVAAVTLLAYWPGLSGQFVFDDVPNIVDNPDLKIETLGRAELRDAALSGHAGPLKRPLSMMSFALNYLASGLDPFAFKLTNVIIHLLCASGIYVLGSALLLRAGVGERRRFWLALFIAGVWAVHPLNLTAVLYVVQRMASLSALFSIWALAAYAIGRNRLDASDRRGWAWILAGLLVGTPAATLAKENGALLPLLALTLEIAVFQFRASRAEHRGLIVLFALTAGLPALAAIGFFLANPDWLLSRYSGRDFTLWERLLTEAGILWHYMFMSFVPNPGGMALFHDDWPIARGLLSPLSTLAALSGLAALAAAAFLLRRRYPLAAAGILFFLAGHTMESTVLALELMYEHRNYLPLFGLLLLPTQVLLAVPMPRRRTASIAATALIVVLAASTFVRSDHWGDPLRHAITEVAHSPNSPRANHYAGNMYAEIALAVDSPRLRRELLAKAEGHYRRASELSPGFTAGLYSLISLASRTGRQIDDATVEDLTHRLSSYRVRAESVNHLRHLIVCRRQGLCQVDASTMDNIIRALLENPTLKRRTRAMTLVAAANYLINQAGDVKQSLALAHQAIASDPDNLPLRLNVADVLLSIRQWEHAERQLKEIASRDSLNLYTTELSDLRQRLKEGRAASIDQIL